MPYPNEHAARITDPGQYDRIRRKNNEFGKGIHVLYGIADGKTEVQAIRFDADKFTVAQARKWLKDHDYKPIEFSEATGGDKEARGQGQGVGGPKQGIGGPDECVCPECGARVPHEAGTPCTSIVCPKCGTKMVGIEKEANMKGDDELNLFELQSGRVTEFQKSPRNPYGTHASKGHAGGKSGWKRDWRIYLSGMNQGAIQGTIRRIAMIAAGMKPPCQIPEMSAEEVGPRSGSAGKLPGEIHEKPKDYGLSKWKTPGEDNLERKDIQLTCEDLKNLKRMCLQEIQKRKQEREKKAKESLSLDQRSRQVRDAWQAQFAKSALSVGGEPWPKEVFDDAIIIEVPDGLLSYPYTINDDGEIEFGEPEKVEITYQKVSEFLNVAIAPRHREAEEAEFEGHEWDVTIIGAKETKDLITVDKRKFIRSKNGRLYDIKALKKSVPMWEGVKVYDNHLTDEEFKQKAGMRSVAKEWIGSITSPKWIGGALPRLDGVLKIVEESVAKKLKNAWDQGVLGTIGLSIDALTIQGQEAEIEGQRLPVMEGFQKILSVDLVAEPAAGGGFNRLIAANISQEVTVMDKEQLKDLVTQLVTEALADSKIEDEKREGLIEAVVNAALAAKLTEAEDPKAALEPLVKAMIVVESQEPQSEPEPAASAEPEPVTEPEPVADAAIQERMRKLECKILLRDKLDEAKLSEPMRCMIEGLFDGKVFETTDLDGAIKRAKEAQAAHDPGGRVIGAGGQRGQMSVGLSEQDVAEIEFLRLVMGNSEFRALEHVESDLVKERVTESYHGWVKAGRPRYSTRRLSEWLYEAFGDPFETNSRFYEASTTSSMSSIIKNAMNVMLANDYAKRQRWWDPIVKIEEVDTIDQATLVRVFGLNTLSVVNEGAVYTELGWVDEEETASFVKKGNYVGITLETLLSDKVQAVRSIPNRLAASWHNTISALVSAVFTTNSDAGPALADGYALFNATAVTTAGGHANLLTAALNYTNYGASRSAMMVQTDQYSGGAAAAQGQRMLIRPRYIVVPVELEAAANAIFSSQNKPGSANNDINPYFKECQVVVDPHQDDANDWALVADPNEFPAIWLIFLRGRQVPELFTAGDEASGAMFTNDTLRYKVRMLTYRFSSTYDCAPVSDWRPLHKNNVS